MNGWRTLLAGAALPLVLLAGLGVPSAALGAESSRVTNVTFRPKQIGFSGAELANSFRGAYAWGAWDTDPATLPSTDIYFRDQVNWGWLEPTQGSYDFGWMDSGLNAARLNHGKFGFRVMAYCPGCWMNRPDRPPVTPGWLPVQSGTDIPDWNNEAFLSAWEDLMHDLGQRYAADPALGWVDVGGYGDYGEWWTSSGEAITVANASRMVQAVLTNFPTQHVVINAMVPKYVRAALALDPRVGLRVDSLGCKDMYSYIPSTPSTSIERNRWKTAPLISEWCSVRAGGKPTLGATQVTKYHLTQVAGNVNGGTYAALSSTQKAAYRSAIKHSGYRYQMTSVTMPSVIKQATPAPIRLTLRNRGSAPTYDEWRVRFQVRKFSGRTVAAGATTIDLRKLLPGSRTYRTSLTVNGIPPGRYRLYLSVHDPSEYLAPMRLANKGRINGGYPIGTIRIR